MTMITLTKYAEMHGKATGTVRQMALRGGLRSARKEGRDWMVDSEEPYPDHRLKTNQVFTREGYQALDATERKVWLKWAQVRQFSAVGDYQDSFAANWARVPQGLRDALTPEQLAWIVDLLYQSYRDGQHNPDM